MGLFCPLVADDHHDAVCRVLAVAFIVENGVPVQPDKGIQVCVGQGVAGHLHVLAEHLHVA